MPPLTLRTRILAPFAVILALIAGAILADSWVGLQEVLGDALQTQWTQSRAVEDAAIESESGHLTALAASLAGRPDLAAAMQREDRETLFQLAAPLFAAWQRDLGITHFYFHRPGGTNLLRVHLKDKFDDPIRRISLQRAMASDAPASAIELGLTGEWVLRVVVPWRWNGRLIGYLELGTDMERIYSASLGKLNFSYLALLDKERIPAPEIWEGRRSALGFSPFPWAALPRQVVAVASGTVPDLAALTAALEAGAATFDFDSAGHRWHARRQPLLDPVGGEAMGSQILLVDQQPWRERMHRSLVTLVGIEIVLFLALMGGMGGYLGRVQEQLDLNTRRLEQAVAAKTGELITYQSHLEDLVAQRTAQLRTALQAAQDASLAKSNFIANMSHELSTPLHGILGMTTLALGTQLDEEQRDYLGVIQASASDLNQVLRNILSYSQAESRSRHLDRQPFVLAELVDAARQKVRAGAIAKNLELRCTIGEGLPPCWQGDAGKIAEVLDILMDNAIKFTSAGHVAIIVEPTCLGEGEGTLRFTVSDTGPGIVAERRDSLFDPFTQGDASFTRAHGGIGLGLAIARQLVDVMGGQLAVDSEPGHGSHFSFTVPLQVGAAVQS